MLITTLALAASADSPIREDAAQHLVEAWHRFEDDDYAGARQAARSALEIPGSHDQEAAYVMGRAWQMEGFSRDALLLYRDALARQPHGAFTDKLEFHIAETLHDTGESAEALRWLRQAKRGRELGLKDAAMFDLNEAMFVLGKGSTKRGTKKVLAALEETDHDIATWHQAKARTLLVTTWLDVADQLGTDDATLLERRAILIDGARKQLEKTIPTQQPDFTLDQILRIAQSYERLGDDVVTTFGNPADLPPDERKKVEAVWVKATRFYDIGIRHAARTSSDFDLETFESAHAVMVAKVDAL
ncbi:MAG: tetratricopeptide repeat protein [Alphaproteobacteria bacterium]|nr:tetratricopeptide repeat protein [Alphaproteobacteria bacterium]